MTANVIQLPPDSVLRTPIGHVIRTGDTFYRKLERLHAEDRLPAGAVIVDASRVRFQREFVQALRDQRADISLDTKAAELSAIGKFRGRAKEAPWAPVEEDRPLKPDDFKAGANIDLFGKIARLAIEVGVTSVMAPTHFLRQGGEDAWLLIDRESVLALRDALDREGGNRIGIDYPLILPHTFLPDEGHRKHLMAAICDLPIDNLVLRLSGFGADAGPLTIRRTLIAIHKLHPLGYPILLDHIGGLVGVSTIAFGIASGIAHGIGERERFDGRDWHKPQKVRETGTSFGSPIYLPVPGLDKSFRIADLEVIANAPGGHRLVVCNERECCPRGLISMQNDPRAHIARQNFTTFDKLLHVPDAWRIGHFLDVVMRDAERTARDAARIRTGKDKLDNALVESRKRIDSMTRMYESLAEQDRPSPLPLRRRYTYGGSTERGSA